MYSDNIVIGMPYGGRTLTDLGIQSLCQTWSVNLIYAVYSTIFWPAMIMMLYVSVVNFPRRTPIDLWKVIFGLWTCLLNTLTPPSYYDDT